jgi:hypothetical protein
VPAKVKKELEGSSAGWVGRSAQHYVDLSRDYLRQGIGRVDGYAEGIDVGGDG